MHAIIHDKGARKLGNGEKRSTQYHYNLIAISKPPIKRIDYGKNPIGVVIGKLGGGGEVRGSRAQMVVLCILKFP